MDQKTEACSREIGTGSQYTHMHTCTLVYHFQAWTLSKVDNLRNIISSIYSVDDIMHTEGARYLLKGRVSEHNAGWED